MWKGKHNADLPRHWWGSKHLIAWLAWPCGPATSVLILSQNITWACAFGSHLLVLSLRADPLKMHFTEHVIAAAQHLAGHGPACKHV